jgi:hypothetical protein
MSICPFLLQLYIYRQKTMRNQIHGLFIKHAWQQRCALSSLLTIIVVLPFLPPSDHASVPWKISEESHAKSAEMSWNQWVIHLLITKIDMRNRHQTSWMVGRLVDIVVDTLLSYLIKHFHEHTTYRLFVMRRCRGFSTQASCNRCFLTFTERVIIWS